MAGVIHDLGCTNPKCSHVESNAFVVGGRIKRCPRCHSKREIVYSTARRRNATVHPSERAVVWMNRATGSVATPPLNNVPMPLRYSANGYERVEFESLHSLDRYCKERKLVNAKASFDNSGNDDDL